MFVCGNANGRVDAGVQMLGGAFLLYWDIFFIAALSWVAAVYCERGRYGIMLAFITVVLFKAIVVIGRLSEQAIHSYGV